MCSPEFILHCSVCHVLCHPHYFFIFADSSPSHPSVTTHSLPPALSEDNDEFSDFQGPLDAPASFPPSSSTSGLSSQAHVQPSPPAPRTGFSQDDDEFSDFVQGPVNAFPSSNLHVSSEAQVQPSSPSLRTGLSSSSSSSLPQSLPASVSIPTVTQHSAVTTSSQSTFQGNSSFALLTPPSSHNLYSTIYTSNESGGSFFTCSAAFIADAEYFHWYVWILSWFWPALQCESMQPAQQMACPRYLNL